MSIPFADSVRPKTLSDIVGQEHLFGDDKLLGRLISNGEVPNLIFYGPSGVGKTTVANIIAKNTNKKLHYINATNASLADIKDIISEIHTLSAPNGILLYLDEIQYFNKKQQQSLLEYVESGDITLIAATTENPYFYIYGALISRCSVFEFKSVSPKEIVKALKRAVKIIFDEYKIKISIDDKLLKKISENSDGDVRRALNTFELLYKSMNISDGDLKISEALMDDALTFSSSNYDKNGELHYDIISAFQKSMRGSDSNAAIHYLARLLNSGDMLSAIRRLMVCACEDVGLAYPQIIPIVKSACDMALQLGLPEAGIPLADAVILVCNSPKSNSAYLAINEAMNDIQSGHSGDIPRNLQNKHFDGEDNDNKGQGYLYPHDYENHWIKQSYLPKALMDREYYSFGKNKLEQKQKIYWEKIKGVCEE